jgi:hypothetical protein
VTYREFENPEELRADLHEFFSRVARAITGREGVDHIANSTEALPGPEPHALLKADWGRRHHRL